MEKYGAENRDREAEPLSSVGLELLGALGGPLRFPLTLTTSFVRTSQTDKTGGPATSARIDP